MVIRHVYQYGEMFFETEVQKVANEVLKDIDRELVDIKYSSTCDPDGGVQYSALLIFE